MLSRTGSAITSSHLAVVEEFSPFEDCLTYKSPLF